VEWAEIAAHRSFGTHPFAQARFSLRSGTVLALSIHSHASQCIDFLTLSRQNESARLPILQPSGLIPPCREKEK
jgi:hypothetical protein